MSDSIKHECGIGMIRLRKPLQFYYEKYGTALYGINKLNLLMQKQRNRGQDGAGIATIKLDPKPGNRYISRKRSVSSNYLEDLFSNVYMRFNELTPEQLKDVDYLQKNIPYTGELLLGHLRYGTHGDNSIESCHPFLRQNNWISRNFVLAGNFNLTNVDELFEELVELGQYPKQKSDTVTVLEKIGHFLDDEVQRLFNWYKPDGYNTEELNQLIFKNLDIQRLLRRASKKFDGGYVMAGMIGHGDAFMMRDPSGIRPAYYYIDDEIIVTASERPAIQTAFDIPFKKIKELERGHALIMKRDGRVSVEPFIDQLERSACSFERIYFSRGTDKEIYLERKKLGAMLAQTVLKKLNYNIKDTVFSFVPNTAETSFLGLVKEVQNQVDVLKKEQILALKGKITAKKIEKIFSQCVRVEKIIVKDAKLRTFIVDDSSRDDLVAHAYDVTYGIVKNDVDTLVLIDDSIVRGTTLKKSIITAAAKLHPKKIIVVSSAPQIRFPDCYGIDMSKISDFVAFRALVELIKETKQEHILNDAYEKCKLQAHLPKEDVVNEVAKIYDAFTYEEVSNKIAEIITPDDINIPVEVIYQTIEDLQVACPDNNGDWYFSGNYPTPGGNKVVNRAFMNYMENKNERAY